MEINSSFAILGGSFNPIHSGHIEMAVQAHEEFELDNIIIMPNKTTYYKESQVFVSDEHRLNMIELAAEDYPYMSVSKMEIERGGVTHTIDTIREFNKLYPGIRPYFIIGGDSLEWIDKWVEGPELLKIITVLTAIRGTTDRAKSEMIIERLESEYEGARLHILDMDENPVSSSEIRERRKAGLSIHGMVPEKVEEYIINNSLYIS